MAMRTAALVLSLSLIPLAAMAQERSETHKKVSANAPFEIKLVANPSTGYQWKIDTAESAGLDRLSVNDLGTSPPPQMSGEPRGDASPCILTCNGLWPSCGAYERTTTTVERHAGCRRRDTHSWCLPATNL